MSKNHYHITVKCTADELAHLAKLTKSKPTNIDLHKEGNSQIDRMLTKYHRDLHTLECKARCDISKIESFGFKVSRLKIEEVVDSFTNDDVGKYKYLEGHLKVKSDKDLPEVSGFILSGNNDKTNTRFYNFRIRNLDDYNRVFCNINKLQGVVEKEFERVIVDTNELHDRWWG
ncbi:hypothetical protein Barba22A_gp087 [Rheinheimera phage vB_RspM_Barba22A]|uniref:Uncharacterized protein n=82 Tax=Barbavirus TaxID=2733095 RepID=A0A7G9VRX2_9CAUD|nr:hypothetical protein HOV44_gp095 [Rheinheimera phage Barba5S]YP_009822827.1 hypothetical protein HOV45_gp091 [Rheinheimera phage Barba8S]YP_009822964.1 hypothetical protein HOV46_gp087 [Rheinheimera phage vB_RspM_Barba18A]QCQ57938.1 hypothetical protein Barba1A_gp087 [Rheinheimera phage vB_RspM_Barba1A]QCQ58074.1 hypothetical protein Barba1S_gp087 [Rheinheimera phage vB_RspM_Barba1S]QCQ58210.1 hypothetical protein Barba2A_gp087 [Rheinheimera phage vB_RspM_Barba2A]QCQ58346.1 hypothetical pr